MFKVGDKVYRINVDGVRSYGKIINVFMGDVYPVVAEFDGHKLTYTLDGRFLEKRKEPSIFLAEDTMFEVGDEVSAFGVRGIVEAIRENEVIVALENRLKFTFYKDGMYFNWAKEPSLKLIKKAKKKVKKTIEALIHVEKKNPFRYFEQRRIYSTKELASDFNSDYEVQKISFEIEVEE